MPPAVAIGGAALAGGILGSRGQRSSVSTQIDPATQRYIEQYLRPFAQRTAGQIGGLEFDPLSYQQFLDPFQADVIGRLQTDFDRLRGLGLTRTAQEATGAGAFGGSRSGILQAQSLRDIGDIEARTLAGVRSSGFESAMSRALGLHGMDLQQLMLALQAAQGGIGVPGQTQTSRSGGGFGGFLSGALGGGLAAAGGFGGGGGGFNPSAFAGTGAYGAPPNVTYGPGYNPGQYPFGGYGAY